MKLDKLKQILDSEVNDELKELLVLQFLSKQETIIPDLLKILEIERISKKELISDMNLELSRAHIYIDLNEEKVDKKNKNTFTKSFVIDKIAQFYFKYSETVNHCFNRFNK